ncbi:MAG: hypothetical protein GY953_33615 [bacterium]|nr:hypothetical protein [bacterium]
MRWIAFSTVTLLLAMAGCVGIEAVHDPKTESESVEIGKAELVTAEISMPAGELEVASGAEKLLEGDFTFTAPELRPEVSYQETGFRGRLKLQSSAGKGVILRGQHTNHWKVRLNKDTPLDLHIKLGAGEGNLELSGLDLRSVDVEMGAGEMGLDLTGGEWTRDFDVKIRGGVGEANVRVPNDVGVVAEAAGGIGEIQVRGMRKRGDQWYNDAYGESPATIRLDVKGGIGEINIVCVD